MTTQADSFQSSIKTHQSHVEVRNKRVEKYGTGSGSGISMNLSKNGLDTQKYALFGGKNEESQVENKFNVELRNRRIGLLSRQTFEETKIVSETDMTNTDVSSVSKEQLGVVDIDDKYHKRNLGNTSVKPKSFEPEPFGRSSGANINPSVNPSVNSVTSFGSRDQHLERSSFNGLKTNVLAKAPLKDTSRLRGAEKVEASIAQVVYFNISNSHSKLWNRWDKCLPK